MRFDDDGVTGCQAGEQPRIAIPGREGAATNDQTNAARHDFPVLFAVLPAHACPALVQLLEAGMADISRQA
jgi:hypothetical protein